jgi:fermentation-respiration switch protein FrsA (DUF1100 family)
VTGRSVRRLAGALVAALGILYASALVYLRLNERAFIFLPDERTVAAPPADLDLRERRVTFPSSDGVTLAAWIVPSATSRPSDRWMLLCHGNLGNVGYAQRPEFYAFMREVGVNLLAFDYRGYGESTGTADERGVYDDATASYEYLRQTVKAAPGRIVIFGHSLGSGVAIELATRVPAAGLIVDGGFTSVVERAQEQYPFFPIALIATQRFASIDRIQAVAMPKLILHSPEDAVIPYAHGRRLFEAAPPPKRFVDIRGGHEYAYRIDRAVYFGAIEEFLRTAAPETE